MKRRDMLKGLVGSALASQAIPSVSRDIVLDESQTSKIASTLTLEQQIAMEREIRRYVKSSGGFRKDQHEQEIIHCTNLLGVLGRSEPCWDFNIHVPGMEAAEAKHRPQPA